MAIYEKSVWKTGDLITAEKINEIEKQLEINTPGATNVAKDYEAGNHNVGDYCLYKGTLYRCIKAGAGAPPTGWIATTVADEIGTGVTNSIAQDFSTSKTYAVGDYVVFEQNLYRCIAAVETAGAWNASKWTAAILADDVDALNADFTTLVNRLKSGKIEDAELHLGFYLDEDGDLCQVE